MENELEGIIPRLFAEEHYRELCEFLTCYYDNKQAVITIRPKARLMPGWLYRYLVKRLFVVADKVGVGPYISFEKYRSLDDQARDEEFANNTFAE